MKRKFLKSFFGPYIVKKVYGNATYTLCELDGTEIKNLAGKRVKMFKKKYDSDLFDSQEMQDEHLDSNTMEICEEEDDDLPRNIEDNNDIQLFVDLNEDMAHARGCEG